MTAEITFNRITAIGITVAVKRRLPYSKIKI